MSNEINIEREYDRNTLKIAYLEIQKYEKSVKLCPEIVLWRVKKQLTNFKIKSKIKMKVFVQTN